MSAPNSPMKRSTRALGSGSRSRSNSNSNINSRGFGSPVKQQNGSCSRSGGGGAGVITSSVASTSAAALKRPETPSRKESYIRRQAMFCDVVVEGMRRDAAGDWLMPPELAMFIEGLGERLRPPTASPAFPTTPSKVNLAMVSAQGRPPDVEKLRCVLQELLTTEQNYVARLRTLHDAYYVPLRNYAARPREEIIPIFEVRQIFGNLEAIFPANIALLHDLRSSLDGPPAVHTEHWASAILRHLNFFATIYPAYLAGLENARTVEQKARKRNPAFARFIESTRYASTDGHDNSSLESLLIEPAQRIPRYLLILRQALKELSPEDPARDDVLAAMDVASRIASLDEDEQTRRAAALWGLNRSIENLPAVMTNSNRYFIDCIDCFDTPLSRDVLKDVPGTGYSQHTQDLLCTLFLFNDYLVIAKRKVVDKTGRQLVGLNDINELTRDMLSMQRSRSGLGSPFKSRSKSMEYCGRFDLNELVVVDSNRHDFKIFLEKPPADLPEKFNDRPLRHFVVVKPETETDKSRFLQNIWQATAHLKGQGGRSMARKQRQDSQTIYWNLYDRKGYALETRKAKMAVQLSEDERVPDLSLLPTGPHAVYKAVLLDDAACSYTIDVRGQKAMGAPRTVTRSELVRHIIGQARNLRLYNVPPSVPGMDPLLDRQASPTSTRSRALSASSSRPRSVLDFVGNMLSPAGADVSPHRTLSKASKTSSISIDSRRAASIFSGEYASTAGTSVRSPSPFELGTSSRPPAPPAKRPSMLQRSKSSGILRSESSRSHRSEGNKLARGHDDHEASESPPMPAEGRPREHDPDDVYGGALLQDSDEQDEAMETLQYTASESRRSHSVLGHPSTSANPGGVPSSVSRSKSVQNDIRQRQADMKREEHTRSQTPTRQRSHTPELLSPRTLQRSGTLSRPFGPRQLGSPSPQGPRPAPLVFASSTSSQKQRNPDSSRQESPADENDPFLAQDSSLSLSQSKKRTYSDETDSDSTASKRQVKDFLEQIDSSRTLQRTSTPEAVPSQPQPIAEARSSVRREESRTRPKSVRDLAHKELQRVGSLPRSPKTRSLYQQGRPLTSSASLSSLAGTSGATPSRFHRKPAPPVIENGAEEPSRSDTEMQVDLVRRQSQAEIRKHLNEILVLREENQSLKRQLAESQDQIASLVAKLSEAEEAKSREFDEVVKHVTKMADEKIEEHSAVLEAKVAVLETRLRNQKRAYEAQLRAQAGS